MTPSKYPRTPHLPWSPGGTSDDSYLFDVSHFEGHEVVVTEKLDGENTSMYPDIMHARSPDGRHHPSRDWVKALHARIRYEIPENWRLCGENVYAQHSIRYESLESYFYLFSIWNNENEALSWDETQEWAKLLEISTAPVLFRGEWDQDLIGNFQIDEASQEGYVVRLAERFSQKEFNKSIAKWVRPHHVQTSEHWMHAEIVPNQLKANP